MCCSWQNVINFLIHTYNIPVKVTESVAKTLPVPDVDTFRNLVAGEMDQVDQLIQKRLHSDIELIDQLGHYIINSGGKRLRPILLILVAKHYNYTGDQHINLAAIIEFIHTATLLHDDVVDASLLRRGKVTANQRWGNEASVLVGDFLYSRAFQMMVKTNSMRVMEILSDVTNVIAEGEVQQLLNCHDPETTEARYLEVIRNKTAKLFEAAGQLAAIISGRPVTDEKAMAEYGRHLGAAFQLIDDVLDYSADINETGKNVGDDLAEGKPTLPLLYAMWHSPEKETTIIKNAIINGGLDEIDTILSAINQSGALEYTANLAQQEAVAAVSELKIFEKSIYMDALYAMARFAVERQY